MVINLAVLVFRGSIVQSWACVSRGPGRTHTQGAYKTEDSEEDMLEGPHDPAGLVCDGGHLRVHPMVKLVKVAEKLLTTCDAG